MKCICPRRDNVLQRLKHNVQVSHFCGSMVIITEVGKFCGCVITDIKDSVYLRSKVTLRWLNTGLRYKMIFYKQKFRHIDDIFFTACTRSSLNNFGCGQWWWYVDTLKRKCRHVDEPFLIACVGSCPAQPVTKISSKWRHFRSNVSLVVLPLISHPKGVRSVHCESIKCICFI